MAYPDGGHWLVCCKEEDFGWEEEQHVAESLLPSSLSLKSALVAGHLLCSFQPSSRGLPQPSNLVMEAL